jgi:hypothetical protein
MHIQQELGLLVMGVLGASLGVALAIFSSIRAAKIRDYVIQHALAPDQTRSHYFRGFDFPSVCAAYEKATHDRASIWITYLTGLLGMILFLGSGSLVLMGVSL